MLTSGLGTLRRMYAEGGEVRNPAARGLPAPGLHNLTIYADTVSRNMYPRERDNAKRDAARHMIASALAAQKLSPGMAEFLGRAHEWKEAPLRTTGYWLGLSEPRGDYPVDMHNNALGVELGRRGGTVDEMLAAVERAIREGSLGVEPGRVSLQPDPNTSYAQPKARGGLTQVKECRCHG